MGIKKEHNSVAYCLGYLKRAAEPLSKVAVFVNVMCMFS
jgi:hypothetical protein